jgi:VWFA-related protein
MNQKTAIRLSLRFSLVLAVMLACFGAVSAMPAAPNSPEDDAERIPVVGDVIDVRVVNVEIVATDEKGNRLRGLSPADFRLLVDGKEVPIEFFTEVEEGKTVASAPVAPAAGSDAVPTPLPPSEEVGRSYLVFVDDSFAVGKPRDVVLDRLDKDLGMLQAQDRMAVLAFDGYRIDVLSPWTSDKAALAAALSAARGRASTGNRLLAQDRNMQSDVDYTLNAALEAGLTAGEADKEFLEALGKRVNPEARTQLGRTAHALAGALRGFEAPPGRKVMLLLSGGWSLQVAPQLFVPLIRSANQLGYTIYPVDVASPTPETLKALDQLAMQTGGRVANVAGQDVFRQVVADSGSYYWLGFTPSWKGDDGQHQIRFEAARPGLQVRARSGFTDLSKRTETAMRAEGVLLFGGQAEDRTLKVELGEMKEVGSREVEVPVTLGVPVEALALTQDDKGFVAEAPLVVAALDAKGARSDLPTSRLRVQVKEPPRVGGYARFQTTLRLRRADQKLVFTVHDAVNGHPLWQEVEFHPQDRRQR